MLRKQLLDRFWIRVSLRDASADCLWVGTELQLRHWCDKVRARIRDILSSRSFDDVRVVVAAVGEGEDEVEVSLSLPGKYGWDEALGVLAQIDALNLRKRLEADLPGSLHNVSATLYAQARVEVEELLPGAVVSARLAA